MKLRNITFKGAIMASGTQNFYGEGWWYHILHKLVCLIFLNKFTFKGSTFVSKTTLVEPRIGNMPLIKGTTTPSELKPKCIYVNFWRNYMVNNVSLSGPGLDFLINEWKENLPKDVPWMLSFMTTPGVSVEISENEVRTFVIKMQKEKGNLPPFAVQWNISCPNTGEDEQNKFMDEIDNLVSIMNALDVPIVIKISCQMSIFSAIRLENNEFVDAICVSNTIPWDSIPEKDRLSWFGRVESPLAKYQDSFNIKGNGGVSGPYLYIHVCKWIEDARSAGFAKPIIAGGGIMSKDDVKILKMLGADAVSPGMVAVTRPWRLRGIINYANYLFREFSMLEGHM